MISFVHGSDTSLIVPCRFAPLRCPGAAIALLFGCGARLSRYDRHAPPFPRTLPRADRGSRAGRSGLRHFRCRARPAGGGRRFGALSRQPGAVADRRHPARPEGHHRDPAHADRHEQPDLRRLRAAPGRGLRHRSSQGRRGLPRQDRHHRICLQPLGPDAQSLRHKPNAGRFVLRLRGRGRRRNGAGRARYANPGVGDQAGILLRRLCAQAVPQSALL